MARPLARKGLRAASASSSLRTGTWRIRTVLSRQDGLDEQRDEQKLGRRTKTRKKGYRRRRKEQDAQSWPRATTGHWQTRWQAVAGGGRGERDPTTLSPTMWRSFRRSLHARRVRHVTVHERVIPCILDMDMRLFSVSSLCR